MTASVVRQGWPSRWRGAESLMFDMCQRSIFRRTRNTRSITGQEKCKKQIYRFQGRKSMRGWSWATGKACSGHPESPHGAFGTDGPGIPSPPTGIRGFPGYAFAASTCGEGVERLVLRARSRGEDSAGHLRSTLSQLKPHRTAPDRTKRRGIRIGKSGKQPPSLSVGFLVARARGGASVPIPENSSFFERKGTKPPKNRMDITLIFFL